MKQTVVEWLEFRYKNSINLTQGDFEQDKEMEKQQIENAYFDSTSQFSVDARMDYPKSAEQYYNETFNN